MNKDDIIAAVEAFVSDSPGNYISADAALTPDCAGMKMYEPPIFAFGSANDSLYAKYKGFDAIGAHFLAPAEWLPSAKTVISLFLPYTDKIKAANATDPCWPAAEWLHGRYEGQLLLEKLLGFLVKLLSDAGYKTLAPSLDTRFKVGNGDIKFTSNWSERHVAYACGLGTFGLSKGIITKKGMCGRLGSVLTELDLPKDLRAYGDIYEYCTSCGLCIDRCPVHAVSFGEGKKHLPCSNFLDGVKEKHKPRYGCGACQVSVPCQSGIPSK